MYMTPYHLHAQSHMHLVMHTHTHTHTHTCWLVAPSAKASESTSPSMKSLPMEATTVVTEPMSDSTNYTTNTNTHFLSSPHQALVSDIKHT